MTYEEFISDAVKVVEAIGATIMVVGGAWALVGYVVAASHGHTDGAYRRLRQTLAA